MSREEPDQMAALRAIVEEIVGLARAPDAPEAASGYGLGLPGVGEEPLRTVEGESGETQYPLFTELDSTQSGAMAV